MKKDKFIMPRTVIEAIRDLPDYGFVRMLEAICDYEFEDKLPEFDGKDLALFNWCLVELDKWNRPKVRRNGKK